MMVEMQINIAIMEIILEVLQEIKNRSTIWLNFNF